jgi:hypothetical protein
MNRIQQKKVTRQEPDCNPHAPLLCIERTGLVVAYRAIRVLFRERDIRETGIRERDIRDRDLRERDIRQRSICESVDTCRFAQ